MEKKELKLTAKQEEAIREALESEEDEFTFKCATGFGKSYLLCRLLSDETRSIVVFPTLILLRQFRDKYMCFLTERENVFTVCTDAKDLKEVGDSKDWVTYNKPTIKKRLQESDEEEPLLLLTTYMSLPYVLSVLGARVDAIHFDEAHHRSGETIVAAMEKHQEDKIDKVYNYSATPSDEFGGDTFTYNFSEAIQDNAIRDFHVHFIVGDNRKPAEMAGVIKELSEVTGNKKALVFTALSQAEKEGKNNVNSLLKIWKKPCKDLDIWMKGITCSVKPDERKEIIQEFQARTDMSFLVSCRTLGEGTDISGTNCGIFMDAITSPIQIIQSIGRLLRLYRDEKGNPLPTQTPSTVILPIYIDAEAYEQCSTDEERDLFIRNLCETDNGSFASLLNVVSALRQHDEELAEICLHYPSGLKTENLPRARKSAEKQGWDIEDVPKDGNCFFHCVAPTVNESPERVREKVVDYLRHDSDTRQKYGILDADLDDLARDGGWNNDAGDLVPEAYSKVYGEPLTVHLGEGRVENIGDDGGDKKRRQHLVLVDNHYQRMNRKSPDAKETPQLDEDKPNRERRKRKQRFHGHVTGAMKVLWKGEQQNKYLMKLDCRIDMNGKTMEDLWDEKLEQVREFIETGGRLPRKKTESQTEKAMGIWISTQKQVYKKQIHGMQDSERRKKWEAFLCNYANLFKTDEDKWDEMFEKVRQFVETTKKLPVVKAKTKPEKDLGHWIRTQRHNYKTQCQRMKDKLYREKWQLFVKSNADLFKTDNEKWDETFVTLQQFVEKKMRLPSKTAKNYTEKVLANWVNTQKVMYKKHAAGMKDPGRRQQWEAFLQTNAYLLQTSEEKWDGAFESVKQFVETEKRMPCNKTKTATDAEKVLGRWVSQQKVKYAKRAEGMQEEGRRRKWKEFVESNAEIIVTREGKWDTLFKQVQDFVNTCNKLPSEYSKTSTEATLGRWVGRQKADYKKQAHGMKDPERRSQWQEFVQAHPQLFPPSSDDNSTVPTTKSDDDDSSLVSELTNPSGGEDNRQNPPDLTSAEQRQLDQFASMTEQEKMQYFLKDLKSKRKGHYQAPNPQAKDEINQLLTRHKPSKGNFLVLDHTDFKTATALGEPQRTLVPQRDLGVFAEMQEHPEFGRCVIHNDLLNVLTARDKEKWGLVYADLTGSIKEAIPILDALKGRIQKNGIVAVTISCRDGEESAYTNSFATKLLQEVCRRFPRHEVLTPGGIPLVYGEHVRMATILVKV